MMTPNRHKLARQSQRSRKFASGGPSSVVDHGRHTMRFAAGTALHSVGRQLLDLSSRV